jgi:hypothetical protein
MNPVEHFGAQLEAAGFAKYGQETMVSGVTGEEMPADIYVGLVYYQRLRHMVSDKFQVGCIGGGVEGRGLGVGVVVGVVPGAARRPGAAPAPRCPPATGPRAPPLTPPPPPRAPRSAPRAPSTS